MILVLPEAPSTTGTARTRSRRCCVLGARGRARRGSAGARWRRARSTRPGSGGPPGGSGTTPEQGGGVGDQRSVRQSVMLRLLSCNVVHLEYNK